MVSDIHYCLIKATYKICQIWNQGFALTVKSCEPRTETFRNNFETRCIKWNCCLCNHIIEKINNIWFTALFSFVFELLSRIFRVTSILSCWSSVSSGLLCSWIQLHRAAAVTPLLEIPNDSVLLELTTNLFTCRQLNIGQKCL